MTSKAEPVEPTPTPAKFPPTCVVERNGLSIRCLVCGKTSCNPNDVYHRYCGYCHAFHPIRNPDAETSMQRSRAVTLIELLVVIALIVLLMGLVLLFWPKREVRNAAEGASQLQALLMQAKSRALREQQPVGLRLITSDGGKTFTGAEFVIAPEPLAPIDPGAKKGPTIYLDLPPGTAMLTPADNTARQVGLALQGSVEAGDLLEIVEGQGSIHRIVSIDYGTNTLTLAAAIVVPPGGGMPYVSGVSTNAAVRLMRNYRYLRSPRPLMGETPWQLPRDVVIRGSTGIVPSSLNIPTNAKGDWEIRFGPGGMPIGANGRIVLWIDDVNNVAKPTLLCIYPSGAIAAHPVGPAGQEYQFTQDGRDSGQ